MYVKQIISYSKPKDDSVSSFSEISIAQSLQEKNEVIGSIVIWSV